ncbi:MAG: polysaccharide biosynthesis tyrosine autokinase [Verrucomicrobia bacterium]|nr:polysaccharide biosynthesis tyrosine autokinase [Verrucomicrobiota bacterium]MBT7067695.1 polysaccharide biosynthesis tyrosine autokinase [Verrucomicrobiota bacterium]MBT7701548.1 polysaccharide biosynthesis tyrosine autokinase [Verrucomicrobiota bacterium]
MPPPNAQPEKIQPIDIRQYVGIIFFRWQIIAVCFLYFLLAGVLYVHLAPKKYRTYAKVTLYRDPLLSLGGKDGYWTSFTLHKYMLQNRILIDRVVERLRDEWEDRFTNIKKMRLPVEVSQMRGMVRLLTVTVKSGKQAYNEAFLSALIELHRAEWENMQRQSRDSAGDMLETELTRLEQQIKEAEDDKLEYQRLHDIARVTARSTMESRYLEALMSRRSQLSTELMLLEAQFPVLKNAGAAIISDVGQLTRETGAIHGDGLEDEDGDAASVLPKALQPTDDIETEGRELGGGWQRLTAQLAKLEQQEQQLISVNVEHPGLIGVRTKIRQLKEQLELAAHLELARLEDRHKALTIQINAVEAAEYKWQAKNLLASQRKSEYNRIASVVKRYESNYSTLYSRLHNMRVAEELKAEHFTVTETPISGTRPFWPDPLKILLLALAAGVGSGFGLALLMHMLDNKVQSIKDVEEELGVPFLGGVPYWVHSGLEAMIRPIVTEEHSAGAVEAYRALRTTIVAALEKANEKILFVTSADSREGKTLTSLNMAIMMAQMDKKVLLVDMDLRRGRLHRSLGVDRTPGVTDALKEGLSLREYLSGTRIENLDIVPTGSNVDDAAELLQSTGITNLFAEVKGDYDYIIVDTSPVLRVTDTVILASQGIGVVLYIARVNHTPKPLIRYSLGMLSDAHVLGLVMNSIEMHKISSLYYTYQYPNYAYYSNAYAYGYNYYYYGDSHGEKGRRRKPTLRNQMERAGEWLKKTLLPVD